MLTWESVFLHVHELLHPFLLHPHRTLPVNLVELLVGLWSLGSIARFSISTPNRQDPEYSHPTLVFDGVPVKNALQLQLLMQEVA